MEATPELHYRACHLCEATCGLEIRHRQGEILSIRGDRRDPLSRGHFCPKALVLKDIHNDPDRLRQPLKREGDRWKTIDWNEALDTTVNRLAEIRTRYGQDAVGVYLGNPSVHNYGMLTHGGHFLGLLKTRNRYSATSLDQLPHHLVCYWLYGHQMLIPIADIDHTDYFLILGANPIVSNGSLMTVPDVRKRLRALQRRGGKLVVIDPRRSETARLADEHHFIRPGTDAAFLLALLNTLLQDHLGNCGGLMERMDGLETVKDWVRPFTAEQAAVATGIDAVTIRRLAREIATTEKAAVYGRMGVSVQRFGTLCQWAIQMINLVSGHLDKPGGVLFTKPAFDTIGGASSRPGHFDSWRSRVSGLPEFGGELPAVVLPEEILSSGSGQIKALFTGAANPVLTATNGRQWEKALSGLEFMVSLDPYLNETTRFADIILPPTSVLEHDHYDIAFHVMAVRNTTRYSPPLFPKPEGALHDWEIYTELGEKMAKKLGLKSRPQARPDQMLDFALQTGPYSAQAGHELGLTLDKLKEHPHGLDLGPLAPSLPERLHHPTQRIVCAPQPLWSDLKRAEQELLQKPNDEGLLLIGRRHLFSANSWLHNFKRLVKGRDRCLLFMHPFDLSARRLSDGQMVKVASRTGSVAVKVSATEEMMPGVVSLPHGWGHDRSGTRLSVAREHAGVSVNDLTDEKWFDRLSGNAALNGVPVTVTAL